MSGEQQTPCKMLLEAGSRPSPLRQGWDKGTSLLTPDGNRVGEQGMVYHPRVMAQGGSGGVLCDNVSIGVVS